MSRPILGQYSVYKNCFDMCFFSLMPVTCYCLFSRIIRSANILNSVTGAFGRVHMNLTTYIARLL